MSDKQPSRWTWAGWKASLNTSERFALSGAIWACCLLLAALFLGVWGTGLLVGGTVTWFAFKAIAWAARQDEKERTSSRFNRSFLDELKDIEKRVIGEKPEKPKSKNLGGGFDRKDALPCIMCGSPSNRGGRFCDDHDD